MQGAAAKAELHFLLRHFETEGLRSYGDLLRDAAATLQAEEPRLQIEVDVMPQYRNMRYWLEKDMLPVELALEALEKQGIEPDTHPIRGGTDGAGLTAKGVPTPNLFTGMQNPHSPLEWISLQDMASATQLCVDLVQLWAEQGERWAEGGE
jgi:tripeptide aminopeptidase